MSGGHIKECYMSQTHVLWHFCITMTKSKNFVKNDCFPIDLQVGSAFIIFHAGRNVLERIREVD